MLRHNFHAHIGKLHPCFDVNPNCHGTLFDRLYSYMTHHLGDNHIVCTLVVPRWLHPFMMPSIWAGAGPWILHIPGKPYTPMV
jgi:hypothetical protein